MKKLFSSPKTTWAAILALVTIAATQIGFLFDADPTTIPDWGRIISEGILVIGLLFARDNDKSSEDVGNVDPEAQPTA